VKSGGDTDHMAEPLLIGLGTSNGDEQAVAADADVRQMECGDLAGTQRGRVSQQENGAVADADARFRVDARQDLSELGDGSGWAWRRGAVPRMRRKPRRTRRTTAAAVGSPRPSWW
jgi:hypothetical protein